jgi:hypothetical protein
LFIHGSILVSSRKGCNIASAFLDLSLLLTRFVIGRSLHVSTKRNEIILTCNNAIAVVKVDNIASLDITDWGADMSSMSIEVRVFSQICYAVAR